MQSDLTVNQLTVLHG